MSVSHNRRRRLSNTLLLAIGLGAGTLGVVALSPMGLAAQEHEHGDEDHEALHFAHPLFTESPSPDTKLRIDYLFRALTTDGREHSVRLEGEYAFTPSVSVEANIPLTSRSESGTTANAVGSGEIALKLATFAAADRGWLLGGGIAVGVPTGSDRKAIGSAHIIELEPYLDAGYRHGRAEYVGFLSYTTETHRRADEPSENEMSIALSALYHVAYRIESLVELGGSRVVTGEERGFQPASAALGLKYHVGRTHHLVLGIGGRIPITHDRESKHEVLLSALWHF